MKIAWVTLEYPPRVMGGAGIYATIMAREIARLGNEVHVLTPGQSMKYRNCVDQGLHIHYLPVFNQPTFDTLSFWAILPRFFMHIYDSYQGFDVIHGNGISDLTLFRVNKVKRVCTVHHLSSSSLNAVRPLFYERLQQPGSELGIIPLLEPIPIRRADKIIAVSEYTRNDLVRTLGIHFNKIEVIRHGAHPEDFRFPLKELEDLRAHLGVGRNPFVLFVGRLEPRKGVSTLFHAFEKVARHSNLYLVVAGSGSQGKWRNVVKSLGIQDRVVFVGYVEYTTLRKLYAACDLFVCPSLLEGLGLVVLEARAAGKFVVASNVGGIPEVVPPRAGYLVPPGDPKALSQALQKALREVHNNLPPVPSWSEAARQVVSVYESIVEER